MSFIGDLFKKHSLTAPGFDYPGLKQRRYANDGFLESGTFQRNGKTVNFIFGRKGDSSFPRTHCLFEVGESKSPYTVYINGDQTINPAFTYYHELGHVLEPHGLSDNRHLAEAVADACALHKTGLTREQYAEWRERRKQWVTDDSDHTQARDLLYNNFNELFPDNVNEGFAKLAIPAAAAFLMMAGGAQARPDSSSVTRQLTNQHVSQWGSDNPRVSAMRGLGDLTLDTRGFSDAMDSSKAKLGRQLDSVAHNTAEEVAGNVVKDISNSLPVRAIGRVNRWADENPETVDAIKSGAERVGQGARRVSGFVRDAIKRDQ
jgi:hypothetical protein